MFSLGGGGRGNYHVSLPCWQKQMPPPSCKRGTARQGRIGWLARRAAKSMLTGIRQGPGPVWS